jgi:hypothetical protein
VVEKLIKIKINLRKFKPAVAIGKKINHTKYNNNYKV